MKRLPFSYKNAIITKRCRQCGARVTMPCQACRTRARLAIGELRRDRRPDPTEEPLLKLSTEDQEGYEAFWQEFPGGLQVIPLDNSGDTLTITETERWFIN